MSIIGTFTKTEDGYTGSIRTLTLNAKVKIVPTEEKKNENSPDFRILAGTLEIGAGWQKTSRANRPYVSVSIDDPAFAAAIHANLIEAETGEVNLIWTRRGDE